MYDWAEFRHFRYLLAILEKRGFRAAAEELHTSQPNLTVQARQFQENAGVQLFRRSRAGHIRPTESGMAFIALARPLRGGPPSPQLPSAKNKSNRKGLLRGECTGTCVTLWT